MIEALIGAVAGFISAWFGVVLSARASDAQARKQKAEADAAAKEAYLRHLREELSVNHRLMGEIKTYVNGGPVIEEILDPAAAAALHLRFSAWDALVRAGVLAQLSPSDQRIFGAADRTGRKAAQDIETLAANWRRGLAWQRWTEEAQRKGELAMGIPLREFLRQIQRQITDSLECACARTDEALTRLQELLPPDNETPSA
ncbi:MAG TPA: hypothetical protein VNT01_10230 [Symbiobacteriaceae bacterium]|nr:hypothetical protein [Symbiobacteriaceae bacterium]